MKVLIIPSWYPTELNPIAGIFFQEQAIALQRQGNSVVVAYPEIRSLRHITHFQSKSGYNIGIENGIKTYRRRGYNYLPRVKNHIQKTYLKWLENLFTKIVNEEGKPDVIHAHSIIWGGWAAGQIAEKYNIPLVITEHSSTFTRNIIPKSQKRYIVEALDVAAEIIAVGPSLKNELEKYAKKKVEIIPNIVNTKVFAPTNMERNNEKFRFLSLAILTRNKGMDVLLKAFAKAFCDNNDVELIIGGDGQERSYLKTLCKELGIEDKVMFIGELNREQVVNEMQKCDSFVLASRSETFGVVYIEALASGKPVIATKCGGPEMIINEENGMLVKIDDVQELSISLMKMKENIARYDSKQISIDCEYKFGETTIANKITDLYKSTMQ